MLSVDDFEEELQGEYGKIFNNIAYIRAKKRKHRVHERGDGKIGKNPCLVTSYKKEEGKAEILSDELSQTTDKLQSTSEQDIINTNKSTSSTKTDQCSRKGLNPQENESRDCLLYDKVAKDLEAVFNKYMLINSNPDSGDSLEGERNPEITLDVTNESYAEREKPTPPRNQIKYKTVHTKNDILYIWTADV